MFLLNFNQRENRKKTKYHKIQYIKALSLNLNTKKDICFSSKLDREKK